jgi:hypothetical protein
MPDQQHGASLAVAPLHLRRLADICTTFGRTEETVKKWRRSGAPIAFDGASYCAEYNQLQAWLVDHFSRSGD